MTSLPDTSAPGQKKLGLVAFWAINRDQPGSGSLGLYSGVNGGNFDFHNVFKGVTQRFERDIRVPSGVRGTAVRVLGIVGYIARGVALGADVGVLERLGRLGRRLEVAVARGAAVLGVGLGGPQRDEADGGLEAAAGAGTVSRMPLLPKSGAWQAG